MNFLQLFFNDYMYLLSIKNVFFAMLSVIYKLILYEKLVIFSI